MTDINRLDSVKKFWTAKATEDDLFDCQAAGFQGWQNILTSKDVMLMYLYDF